jgi:hypothetical protein
MKYLSNHLCPVLERQEGRSPALFTTVLSVVTSGVSNRVVIQIAVEQMNELQALL